MGTENEMIQFLLIYATGFILAIYLSYVINFKDCDITVGDLISTLFFGILSWMAVLLCVVGYIGMNEDKVIIKKPKKKKPKKKEEFEEDVPLLEEHKEYYN